MADRVDDVTAPVGIDVPKWVCDDPQMGTIISEIKKVRLDLANKVFQAHGDILTFRSAARAHMPSA